VFHRTIQLAATDANEYIGLQDGEPGHAARELEAAPPARHYAPGPLEAARKKKFERLSGGSRFIRPQDTNR
jgi:hypothetical protein